MSDPQKQQQQARDAIALAVSLQTEGRAAAAAEAFRAAIALDPSLEAEAKDLGVFVREHEAAEAAAERRGQELFTISRTIPESYRGIFRTIDVRRSSSSSGNNDSTSILETKEGCAEVREYLHQEGIEEAKRLFAQFMHVVGGVDVGSVADLSTPGAPGADGNLGIVSKRSAGQSALNWYLRSRPLVKAAFRAAYGIDGGSSENGVGGKLITSFDGFGFFRNPESNPDFQGTTDSWLHVDAVDRPSGRYIQGIVNLMDCLDDEDAGIVVVPRSNQREVFEVLCPPNRRAPPISGGFTSLSGAHMRAIGRGNRLQHQAFRVPLPAGSMVLWNSMTLHCNTGCVPRPVPRCDPAQVIRRIVSYICMMPLSIAEDPAAAAAAASKVGGGGKSLAATRLSLFHGGRTTTHQPDVGRWTGDSAKPEWIQAGVVIVDEERLPEGAIELL